MKKIAILIPAFNEKKVIKETIRSAISVVGRTNVYVVDDGSKDGTSQIAMKFTKNVLVLGRNGGKANALNTGIAKFKLTDRYEYIMPIDADTVIAKDFFNDVFNTFYNDKKKKIAAVVGKVTGRNKLWITTYRLWEYEVNQVIHKSAQSMLGAITVCPGPSTVYRSRVFKRLRYSEDTLTEDMDFTFKIHRKKLGRIVYVPTATVSTQDPDSIRSYVKQLTRWYGGFWQCIMKHRVPWGGQRLDAEASLLAIDALLNVLLAILFIFLLPASLILDPGVLTAPLVADLVVFMIPTMLYVSIKRRLYGLLGYLPHFYFLRILGSFIFFYSFLRVTLGFGINVTSVWNTTRYKIVKGEIWAS